MRASIGVSLALMIAAPCWSQRDRVQQVTEQFIPLGLSVRHTHFAEIGDVDLRSRSLTLVDAHGDRSPVAVPESTRIWLDRNPLGLGNVGGSFADCQPGRIVEVAFEDPELRRTAAWIKVLIESHTERLLR